ncbi:MAG TPA: site-specific DNA-methyltransferase [Coleofasciculaceae cyanobacterium]|jgi:adenine-specific DNA-methyltransferase
MPELSFLPPAAGAEPFTDNRIVHGDNLMALEALLPEFGARLRCIYIDPPYNTGNRFTHYPDDLEHTRWLHFMRERLVLMKDLLAEEGVIFVSIGDEECAYLKVLMDEIFGRQNFCGTLVWEKKKKPSFLDRNMGSVTEFILAYARNRQMTGPFIYGQTTVDKRYPLNNAGNTLGFLHFDAGKVRFGCPDGWYEPQDMSEGRIVTRLLDRFQVRNGVNMKPFRLEGEWRYSQAKLDAVIQAGESIIISKVPFRPNHIKPGGEPKKLKNLLDIAHYQMSTYEDATEESRQLFGTAGAFDYPKPEKLLQVLLGAVTQPGDWILDAFAGSGTTGAVAHKMGRQWIMIEHGPHCLTHLVPRLRQVAEGQDRGGIGTTLGWQGGGGFRFFQIAQDD